MREKALTALTLAGLMTATLASSAFAAPPEMKMTTDIPPGIATPDKMETSIGTLNFVDGVPTKETAQKFLAFWYRE